MFKKSRRRSVPQLNTTSTADISFMLLIFFLITTSLDTDFGLRRQLPPATPEEQMEDRDVKKRDLLTIRIDAADRLSCDDQPVTLAQLTDRVERFVDNAHNSPELPEKHWMDIPRLGRCAVTSKHVISLQADPQASYDTYFKVQNAIVIAYHNLRDRLARRHFGHPYDECSDAEREAVNTYYTQRLSESNDTEPARTDPEGKTTKP